ncbi:Eco29kI family restriction endonuclease [Actinospica durhamensis]|uniref:Eco29kI family restriction endonuclease n=1 Tax=Actinospica durhamensis TaxID=1508375 RepID=A0A941EM85_9ACTN|nr:Eco29kI family restriction endonuclease [Actinospica durhamensis]MBR7833483.1 Eco29kI family restriction endonuclease [Actinospica durhamensis]
MTKQERYSKAVKLEAIKSAGPGYNPLELTELARSVGRKLLECPPKSLDDLLPPFGGAGIYALFYSGPNPLYVPISGIRTPIYVGRAIPKGARTGQEAVRDDEANLPLWARIKDHRKSVRCAEESLSAGDFTYRYLVTEQTFIHLAEGMMIKTLRPVWNSVVDGFGIHGPGSGRGEQKMSKWDTVHVGRPFAKGRAANESSPEQIAHAINAHFTEHPPMDALERLSPMAPVEIGQLTEDQES